MHVHINTCAHTCAQVATGIPAVNNETSNGADSLVSGLRERDTRGGNLHGTDDAKLIALK